MLHLALLILVPQVEGVSPEVRSGDGLFYIEAPNLPELLEAYPQAPLLQMVADESVREVVADLLEAGGLSVGSSVSRALAAAGLPRAMTDMPLESLLGMLELIHSASLSVSLSGETSEVAREVERSIIAAERIRELHRMAAEHAEANQGYPPGELFELDVSEGWLADPWGRPYLIEVDNQTLTHEIVCLGSDGVAGGTGFAADLSTASQDEKLMAGLVSSALDFVARVDFTTDESAQVAWDQISGVLEGRLGKREDGLREVNVRGAPARVLEFSELAGTGSALWLLGLDRGISMGVGRDALDRTVARLQSEGSHASASAQVAEVAGQLSESSGATVVGGWVELGRLGAMAEAISTALEAGGTMNINMVPLSGSAAFRTQLDEDRFVSEVAYNLPPMSPMATCVGADPVPESLWAFVPPQAIGVYASSINGKAIYDEVIRSLGAVGHERPVELERLEAEHGISLDRDVIGSLGGGAAVYLLPIGGVLSVPGVAAVVELSDAEAFQRGVDSMLTLLEEKAGGEFSVRYKPYRDQPLWTFSFGGGGGFSGPVQIAPSLAIVNDHLLITLTSTRAKKEIKRLLAGDDGSRHPVLSMRGAPPSDAGSIGFMDWPGLFDGTYEGARAALTMFAGMMDELPIDPELLPGSSTFSQFFEPSVYWTRESAPGVFLSHSESSFGPETTLGMLGGIGALALAIREVQRGGIAEEVEIQVMSDDTEALIEETMETLDRVATRLEVFKIENDTYPNSLAVMIEPTKNYPRGYLGSDELPKDAWGRAILYVQGSNGASHSLWSAGENGEDERGGGDDLRLP